MKAHYKGLGGYGTLGIEIALCILFGSWGGNWLDGKFNTAPVLMILGFFFGLGAAGKAVHESWKQMQKEAAREEREQGNPTPLWEKREERAGSSPPGEEDPRSEKDEHGQE